MVPATTVVVLFAAILTALGAVQRPTQGHQLGNVSNGYDIIFPFTVTQCDPVLIYYNNSVIDAELRLIDASDHYYLLALYLPRGVGYLDWICNIPTGYSFIAYVDFHQYYTVQSGSSNTCLGSLNAAYSYAYYPTPFLQSYTQQSPSGNPSISTSYQRPTVAFPTNSFSTITADPNLALSSTTTTPTVSPTTSSHPTASRHKSTKAIIAAGVIGGFIVVLLIVTITFVFLRKRNRLHSDAALNSLAFEFEPKDYSQPMATQPGPAYSPGLVSPNSGSIDAVRHETQTAVVSTHVPSTTLPYAGLPMMYNSETVETISSFVPITSPVLPKSENIVLSYRGSERSTSDSRNSGADLAPAFDAFTRLTGSQQQAFMTSLIASQRQALVASLNASADATASEASLPEDLPDIANILTVISRARLSARERHAMVASLNSVLVPDQATPADAIRGNLPPPYAE